MPTPLTPARRHAARRVGVPLAVALGALLLYFLRFGYDYGTSDQDEIVPYLLHRLDAGVLAEDWFVAGQAAGYGVRTVFVTLLDAPARWLGPEAAVLGVYVLVWIALAWGVFALARQLTGERLAAALAVAGALVLTPQWTLGGNDMAVRMLVPSMAAWTLAVWGAVVFLRARYLGSGLLLGAAAALQALVGLQMAGVLGVALVLRLPRRDARGADVLRLAGGFLLIALPALAPLVLQQTASAPAPGDGPSLFYMMAAFRNPHHYLPFSFPLASYLRFGLLAFLGGLGFAFLRGRGRLRHGAFVLHVFGVVAALGLVGLVFTEGVPVLGIAKLQLFKTTVFAKLLLVILVCGAAVQGLPEAYLRPLRRLLQRPLLLLGLGLGGWLLVLGGLTAGVPVLERRAAPLGRAATPVGSVEQWARTQTPAGAVFAVPPSWSGFRSHARRAVVVDFKAFPFQPEQIPVWFERLADLAPISLPERADPRLQATLDDAFLRRAPEALARAASRYGIDYVVRHRSAPLAHPAFELTHDAGPWLVYRYRAHEPELA